MVRYEGSHAGWTALAQYAGATIAVALASTGTLALRPWMGTSVSILFFPAIIVTAMYGGYGPSLLGAVLSTVSLTFFIVPPYNSFDVGADDALRLSVFGVVALATASISSARKRAEDAQRGTLEELQGALATLRKVSDWPVFVDAGLAGGARRVLDHAAGVVGAASAQAVWEDDEEPWVYVASSGDGADGVTRHPPAVLQEIVASMTGPTFSSAPFQLEHVTGRVFFGRTDTATRDLVALVQVVAREVGNSLDQLHVHDRLQQLAIREDRIRVARDLHDGVLQSLTGVRFQLQALADEQDVPASTDRLLAIERAIAIEQRELRLFIEDLKPAVRTRGPAGSVALALDDLRTRLSAEWQTPIALRIIPPDLSLPASTERAVRLMVREAIMNALKHANPSRVSVDVEADGSSSLRIVVSNDGRGFPFRGRLDDAELMAANAGPVSLRERVHSMDGTLAIDSLSTGSRLEISLPIS